MPRQGNENAERASAETNAVAVSMPVTEPATNTAWVDFGFILSMLDPREFIIPWTTRKTKIWSLYLMLAGLFAVLEINYDLSTRFSNTILHSNELWLSIFLYGYEPALMLINLMFAIYPDRLPVLQAENDDTHVHLIQNSPEPIVRPLFFTQQLYNGKAAIVIPSHKNADFIQETLKACLQVAHSARQIIVVDNGNSETPLDDTLQKVKSLNPEIQYVWVGKGNKSIAQYVGLRIATEFEEILLIDDDVLLPADFVMPTFLLSDSVDGVCVSILATDSQRETPLFVAWQRIEYGKADFFNLLLDRSRSIAAPHGAISYWKKEILQKVLEHHNLVFYGEDVKLGLIAQHCGYNLRFYPHFPVNTVAPSTVLGAAPNWWGQRVRSWEMIRHARLFSFIRHFITTSKDTLSGTLMLKLSQFNAIYANVADVLRFPVMVVLGGRPTFWFRYVAFQVADLVFTHLWNEEKLKYRPREKNTKLAIWTYWIYKHLLQLIAIPSLARALFIYLPNAKTWKRIPELESAGELTIAQIVATSEQLLQAQGFTNVSVPAPVPRRRETLHESRYFAGRQTAGNIEDYDDERLRLGDSCSQQFNGSQLTSISSLPPASTVSQLSDLKSREAEKHHAPGVRPHRAVPVTWRHLGSSRSDKGQAAAISQHTQGVTVSREYYELLDEMSVHSNESVRERYAHPILHQQDLQQQRKEERSHSASTAETTMSERMGSCRQSRL